MLPYKLNQNLQQLLNNLQSLHIYEPFQKFYYLTINYFTNFTI